MIRASPKKIRRYSTYRFSTKYVLVSRCNDFEFIVTQQQNFFQYLEAIRVKNKLKQKHHLSKHK